MNSTKIIAGEFALSVGMQAWAGIKEGYVPWPATFVRSSIAFSVLLLLDTIAAPLGAIIGLGMMITLFVRQPNYFVGKAGSYDYTAQSTMAQWGHEALKFASPSTATTPTTQGA